MSGRPSCRIASRAVCSIFDRFSIGPRTGRFTSASGADLPGQISWGADYGANDVTLIAARPGIRIGDVSVQEGNGATNLVFTLTLSRSILATASVSATTTDGTAVVAGPPVGGHDYDSRTGTVDVGFDQLTFSPTTNTLPTEVVVASMELFGETVIPQFDTDPVHRTTRFRQAAVHAAP